MHIRMNRLKNTSYYCIFDILFEFLNLLLTKKSYILKLVLIDQSLTNSLFRHLTKYVLNLMRTFNLRTIFHAHSKTYYTQQSFLVY